LFSFVPVFFFVRQSNSTEYSIPEIGLESARAGAGDNITVVELIENTRRELINAPAFQSVSHGEGMAKLMELISQIDEVRGFVDEMDCLASRGRCSNLASSSTIMCAPSRQIIEGTMDATLIVQDSKQGMCYIEVRWRFQGRDQIMAVHFLLTTSPILFPY
jgi:C4-type Zn-finger protein